jgi:hypothetical protein
VYVCAALFKWELRKLAKPSKITCHEHNTKKNFYSIHKKVLFIRILSSPYKLCQVMINDPPNPPPPPIFTRQKPPLLYILKHRHSNVTKLITEYARIPLHQLVFSQQQNQLSAIGLYIIILPPDIMFQHNNGGMNFNIILCVHYAADTTPRCSLLLFYSWQCCGVEDQKIMTRQ